MSQKMLAAYRKILRTKSDETLFKLAVILDHPDCPQQFGAVMDEIARRVELSLKEES